MKLAEHFPENLLNIYTSGGKKMKTIENCFKAFNKKNMCSGFAYPSSDTEFSFLWGSSVSNFLFFSKQPKEKTESVVNNIDAKKQMLTVFIDGNLYYEGEGWHYMSPHEALNAVYFLVDDAVGDKQLMVINFSDNIHEDVMFLIKEDIVDKKDIRLQ